MGGHGKPPAVPSPHMFKPEDVPQLKYLQEKLAEKGLKDPWIRNEVWRYTAIPLKNRKWRAFRTLTRGIGIGFVAFLITISVEKTFGITYGPSHGHDEHH